VKEIHWDDFQRTPDLVAAGVAAAQSALPEIKAALTRPVLTPHEPVPHPDGKSQLSG
jgi:hypothetical protein